MKYVCIWEKKKKKKKERDKNNRKLQLKPSFQTVPCWVWKFYGLCGPFALKQEEETKIKSNIFGNFVCFHVVPIYIKENKICPIYIYIYIYILLQAKIAFYLVFLSRN